MFIEEGKRSDVVMVTLLVLVPSWSSLTCKETYEEGESWVCEAGPTVSKLCWAQAEPGEPQVSIGSYPD